MLEVFGGSKNIQKILLFLFINEKCYGTQLHKVLKMSLTPLQQTLLRLEKGGVLLSYYEGKTRVYHLNPSYPLHEELRSMLKKIYLTLPLQEKKEYYYLGEKGRLDQEKKESVLQIFWKRLQSIKQLSFQAQSKEDKTAQRFWNGIGKGVVQIQRTSENTLIFYEKGGWQWNNQEASDFTNSLKWTFNLQGGVISLEHLRRGMNYPVFLFHLTPTGEHSLSCMQAHVCGEDHYFGQLFKDFYSLRLNWRCIGPQKNEEIEYNYS